MRITSIDRPPRKQRYEVRVDDAKVVPLSPEVLALANLHTGQEISSERLKTLEAQEARHSALAGALRLLALRPRSEREIRDSLGRRNVPPDVLDETLARLRDLRLLDDGAFARTYVDQRDRSSPRGRRLLGAELRSKGVARTEIDSSLESVNDGDAAYRAAAKRARSLAKCSFAEFQRRLGDHLLRRGFGYEISRDTVNRIWEERGETAREA